jgi:dihydroorotase
MPPGGRGGPPGGCGGPPGGRGEPPGGRGGPLRPGRRQPRPSPQLSRRGFLVAGGVTLAGLAVVALDPFGGGGDSGPTVRTLSGAAAPPDPASHTFDLVLRGGRVMDPDSGFDAVADVGVDGGTVTSIETAGGLDGATVVDAKGLVVAPGFIDILSYDPNEYGIWFKVADGVTTNLALHGVRSRAADFFDIWSQDARRPPTHYGGAFSSPWARETLGLGIDDTATNEQIDQMVAMCGEDLRAGFMAVDFEPEYTPGVTYAEIKALTEVGIDRDVPATFHARYSDDVAPGTNAEALEEVLRVARETGARVHVEHIISTGGTYTMRQSLDTLERARKDGVKVTACMYPYDYWATYLASARFNDGWQERFHISYDDLAIVGTGERLTASSFSKYQAENALCAAFAIPESDVHEALQADWVMLGSDAILEEGDKNHPRSTGCFSRAIGRYTREKQVLGLMDALAKATILPARLTEVGAPAMRRKGRLQLGADADLTVFDPERLIDRSTIEAPGTESDGVEFVVVAGEVVRENGKNRKTSRPGEAIKSG